METFVVLLAGFAFYLFLRINRLKQDIAALYKRTEHLNDVIGRLTGEAPAAAPKPDVKAERAPSPVAAQPLPQPPRPSIPEPAGATAWKATQATAAEAKAAPSPPQKPKSAISWEQQIGARLPVWIGGIALALAGIFLVKYSIDSGLLSPAVRCVLAGVLGLALLGGAQWLIVLKTVANGERIAQALAGSGIAVLYGALFASGTVYEFFSPTVTFAGMTVVTAAAVLLSLRHGPPIAMLGMVGGFLTPLLVGASDPNPAVLFGYLSALAIGLFVVVRRENWWWLAWPIVVACYAWVLIWLVGIGAPGDSVWLGLFLIAVCAITVVFSRPVRDGTEHAPLAWASLLATAAVAVAFMTVIVVRGDFGLGEWRLYGLLTVGAIVLAAIDQERYRFLPWITIAPVAALLAVWVTPETETFVFVLVSFAFLFVAAGLFMIGRARHPLVWGALACVAMLGFYLLAYARLYDVIDAARVLAPGEPVGSWPVWGIVAGVLAAVATLVAGRIAETRLGGGAHQLMLGQFAATAIALMTAGLLIEIPADGLPVAIAGLLVAVAFMDARADVAALRPAAGVLTALFVFLILPQFAPLIVYAARVIVDAPLPEISQPLIVTAPLFHLGVPAVLLAATAEIARRRRDDPVVRTLEALAVFLVAVIGYVLIRRMDAPVEQVLTTVASSGLGAVISQVLIVYAIALVAAGRFFGRATLIHAAMAAAAVAIARVVVFDVKLPVLAYVTVQLTLGHTVDPSLTSPAAAAPLFHLALPALLLAALAYVARDAKGWLSRVCDYTVVGFAGLMTYYLVRHAFNAPEDVFAGAGTYVERGVLTNAFLIVGAAAYVAGSRFGRDALRIGGAIAATFAALRLGFFDILVSSPLIRPHDVGSWPIVNALLLPYGLPVVWLLLATVALTRRGLDRLVPAVHGGAMLLVFALVSLNVRQLFQGPILNNPGLSGDSEVYAYSIAWLILGIGLLVAGTWRRDKLIRFASLAVMVLTVGKVFLYDASALTGLFRVLSFLGLGLSLLGLSWFYSRYVFASEKPAQEGS